MSSRKAIGIDIGGTNLRAALVEIEDGRIALVRGDRRELGGDRAPENVARGLADLVRTLETADSAGARRLPVGVGLAGILEGATGRVAQAPNLGWAEVDFMGLVVAHLGRPVSLENDLSAITWGESRFGAAAGRQDALCVFVGTGIGGGATSDGALYRGSSNAAVEIGHTKVVAGGRLCACGAHGCLEAYAGGRQLALQGQEKPSALLRELVDGQVDRIHPGHLDRAACAGDATAAQILGQAARLLGMSLANATVLFNPSCLVLGGTVWFGCPHFREQCRAAFEEHVTPMARQAVALVDATLGDNAGPFGAADLACRAQTL